jgi:hypothetical protein
MMSFIRSSELPRHHRRRLSGGYHITQVVFFTRTGRLERSDWNAVMGWARHEFDHGIVFVYGDSPGPTEFRNLDFFQTNILVLGDVLGSSEKGDFLQGTFALISETGSPDSSDLQGTTKLVYDQSSQRIVPNVFCDYEQRPTTDCNLREEWEQILPDAECPFVDENIRVLEDNFHALRVCNEVGRDVSAFELDADNYRIIPDTTWNDFLFQTYARILHSPQNSVIYSGKSRCHIVVEPPSAVSHGIKLTSIFLDCFRFRR